MNLKEALDSSVARDIVKFGKIFSDYSPEIQAMTRTVLSKLDEPERRNVVENGAASGIPGFTYYSETSEFYKKHMEAIWELLEKDTSEKHPLALIASLNGAEVVTCQASFEQLLAWFAIEEICRIEEKYDNML